MITRLGAVPIFVSDCDRAITFWSNQMRFEVVMDIAFGAGRWVTVARGKGETELILYHPTPALSGDEEVELMKRIGTWTGIILFADDIHETYRELLGRGVEFVGEPRQQFWGGWEVLFVDPDGNRFHLVQRPDGM
jgi:predicted enzyme related to lactoylglutathione lyase